MPEARGGIRGGVAAGPLGAHLVLVGSWVTPPVLMLGGGIVAGWQSCGLAGGLAGISICCGLVVGPPTPTYRTALCTALAGLALSAQKSKRTSALAAAGTVAGRIAQSYLYSAVM